MDGQRGEKNNPATIDWNQIQKPSRIYNMLTDAISLSTHVFRADCTLLIVMVSDDYINIIDNYIRMR